jgi:4-nitrophenyl phosphatase
MELLGVDMDYTIAIGDRLDTDILGAVRTGIRSLMVLCGISNENDLKHVEYSPTWIMQDIRDISRMLRELG